uniref:AlNc14C56G4240 protein n=1 Tax=Albugo laibachii Nc14 TaxID=890382 RepID=F0WC57_9STRA|nr:AlNc14C56G4240 [Albugo laibachii Nc14]|eukprot:CCA18770.1 AlNc14C56G4240 [Albugo laibachii Nc14]
MSSLVIRVFSYPRSDRSGSESYFGKNSWNFFSRKGLGTLEETHEAYSSSSSKKIPRQEEAELFRAQSELEQATSAYRMSNQDQEKRMYKAALHSYHERVKSSSKYNKDYAFDHHMKNMEQSSRQFLRSLDSTCHRVPLEEVLLPTGQVSKNPIDITLQFTDHWGGIIGDKASSAGLPLHP